MSNPADLNTVPQPDTDKNYFNFKATGLKIDTNYAIKFQWVYSDGTVSDWSPGKFVNTSTETVPSAPSVVVPSTSTGSIPVTLSAFPANAKRVDVYVINGIFGTGKVAYSFSSAGTTTIAAPAGTYQVQLITVTPSGINGTPSSTFTITIADVGETIQAPTNPNGFSIDRILAGIQVNWAGTYANGTFTGFEAIKIYVGNTALATSGTYREAGVMTGNNVKNTITIPVDGTYLRYNQPVYIHAAAVNKTGTEGTIQANVANDLLGAKSAVSADLADEIITNAKLVADSVTATKIATGAITTTKIADDAITSPKIVAGSITSAKIDALAITAEKIAADAITATKIKAGEIDVTKLSAGTISVNNLEAGTISSTSYLRAGSKNLSTGVGSRIEISSSAVEDGTYDIPAGLYIYPSSGTSPIFSAPLGGGLSITGALTATSISTSSGKFAVNSGGNLTATDVDLTGTITASSGKIGDWVINSGKLASASGSTPSIELDPLTPQIVIRGSGSYSGYNITLAAPTGITAGSTFAVTPAGYLTSTSGLIGGWTLGSSSFTGGGTSLNSNGTISLTGGTVSGNGESFAAGNLTLNSGAVTSNSTLFLTANDLYYDSNFAPTGLSYPTWVQGTNITPINYYVGNRCTYGSNIYRCVQSHQSSTSTPNIPSTATSGGYLWVEEANSLLYVDSGANVHIGERGTFFTALGSARNALSFRINTFDRGDGYYGRGYILAGLDASEFKMGSINGSGSGYRTIVAGPYGQIYTGRTFYYGSSGSSSAINTEVGGTLGDVYFSTV